MAGKDKVDPFAKLDADDPFNDADGLFDKPSTSFEQLATEQNKGKLVLVNPIEVREKVQTKFTKPGETPPDAVVVDGVVFEDDGTYAELPGTMIFAKAIVGQLRSRVGQSKPPVLGVLTKVPSGKGFDAWLIDPDKVTAEHVKQAKAYLLESQKVDLAG